MTLSSKKIPILWLLICLFAAGRAVTASAPPKAPSSPADAGGGISESVLDPEIDPQIHLAIHQLRPQNATEPDGLLARFDIEYYSIDHSEIQSVQLIWTTPAGFETRIFPKPVESTVYAARVIPAEEDGFHKLRALIVIEGSGPTSDNLRVIEQQYTLEWPQMILTMDWELEMKPSAAAHGTVLSGDDLALLGPTAGQTQAEIPKGSFIVSILSLILVNLLLVGAVFGYLRFGSKLPARVRDWLQGVVPAPRREALLAIAGVGAIPFEAQPAPEPLNKKNEKKSGGFSDDNKKKAKNDKLKESTSDLEQDKRDAAEAEKKKNGKDPLESTQILTDSQAALHGPDDPLDDEEKLNLDDLSF